MNTHKTKSIFVEGPVSPAFIGASIARHSSHTEVGAHSIFLGQVRNDIIDNRDVKAIEYTAYDEACNETYLEIREDLFSRYDLCCLHVYHSLGVVKSGEICLFVFVSSEHRRDAIDACNELVEKIKSKLPIWGKELFNDTTSQWKINI